jgi:hypothetical protein
MGAHQGRRVLTGTGPGGRHRLRGHQSKPNTGTKPRPDVSPSLKSNVGTQPEPNVSPKPKSNAGTQPEPNTGAKPQPDTRAPP